MWIIIGPFIVTYHKMKKKLDQFLFMHEENKINQKEKINQNKSK